MRFKKSLIDLTPPIFIFKLHIQTNIALNGFFSSLVQTPNRESRNVESERVKLSNMKLNEIILRGDGGIVPNSRSGVP